MPLIKSLNSSSSTKEKNKKLLNKTKQTTKKSVSQSGGISGAISQMIAHANLKLGKYKDKYKILITESDIQEYLEVCKTDVYASIDTETTGLDVFEAGLVGVCLYSDSNLPAYIPLGHKSYITGIPSKNQADFEKTKEFLSQCSSIKWVMHNADYDIRILMHTLDIRIECYWDTMIAAKMLDENLNSYKLKDLHLMYCNSEDDEALNFNTLFSGVTFDNIPIDTAYLYAAGDPLKTLELFKYQKEQFEKSGNERLYDVFLNIEMPIVQVVIDMEERGIEIDFDRAKELDLKYKEKKQAVLKRVEKALMKYQKLIENYNFRNANSKLSNPINISSPTQLAVLFYDILKLSSPDKKAPRGTGVEILQSFSQGDEKELCEAILEVRAVEKLLSTYIEKMPKLAERDGRVHCRFNQLGTKTGRFSSNEPNMQNIPSHNKEIRQMFKASDGYLLISADYSKQEVFIAASVSRDEQFIESCENSLKNNTDIYSEIASMIYNVPYSQCTEFQDDGSKNPEGKKKRGNAKNIVLAILYSKGVASIAKDLKVSEKKAQEIYDSVVRAFPKLEETIGCSQKAARTVGYVETAWGRRRHLPDINLEPYEFKLAEGMPLDFDPLEFTDAEESLEVPKRVREEYLAQLKKAYGAKKKDIIKQGAKNKGILIKDNGGFIAQAERQCLNSRIQGSAGDITKVAMILIHNDTALKEMGLKLLLTIHDELIAEAPAENVERASKRMAELMVAAGRERICVPMKVDLEITKNWYEM